MADLGRVRGGPAGGGKRRLRPASPAKVMVTVCAGAGRAVGETWGARITRADVLAALDRAGILTHGICPSCFDAAAPNHAYPPRAC